MRVGFLVAGAVLSLIGAAIPEFVRRLRLSPGIASRPAF